MLVASRRPDGFRRAGRSWPAETTSVALTDLTDAQLAQLIAEPMLDTRIVRAECTDNSVATDSGGQPGRVDESDAAATDVVPPAAEDQPAADAADAAPKQARRPKAAG